MKVTPLTEHVGAVIDGVDLSEPDALDDSTVEAVRAAWLDRGVVFFRDQELSPTAQVALARRFGEVVQPVIESDSPPPVPGVLVLDQVSPRGQGTDRWHCDSTFMASPPMGAILHALELPRVGGDTLFASMGAAYDGLSGPFRAFIDELSAEHSTRKVNEMMRANGIPVDHKGGSQQSSTHPVVRAHPETRRRTLFVNGNFTDRIVELEAHESDRVLRLLYDEIGSPRHQCRFTWTAGAVAFWDNRAVQHYASPDYHERRLMQRVLLAGDEPV